MNTNMGVFMYMNLDTYIHMNTESWPTSENIEERKCVCVHMYTCDMTHYMCAMTHSSPTSANIKVCACVCIHIYMWRDPVHVCHDSFIYQCDMTQYVCAMTHSFTRVP